MGLLPGTTFAGRYEILEEIGKGGMGQVYRARHTGLGAEVALKVLGGFLSGAIDDGEARFEREARAIAKLDHRNCVRVLDYGRTRKHQYIAMELLDGPTLAHLLRDEGRLPTALAVRITRSLLAALAHAHARGVLHRDIKPENVILAGANRRTVLIDFGLAHLRDDAPLTARGMCIGSPSYLAPERLDGEPHDTRADLYAVGVMLYEMLAGERPFVGDSTAEILCRVREADARPVQERRGDVSAPLAAVVARALAKSPRARFASAEDMLYALEDVPVLEELADRAQKESRDEQVTTIALAELVVYRPSWFARLVAWLRFGRWRRRALESVGDAAHRTSGPAPVAR